MPSITGYKLINLADAIGSSAEERIDNLLSSYSCPLNPDVDDFLKNRAKEFAKQRITSTYLVITSYKDAPVLAGYFALSSKVFSIQDKNIDSKTLKGRISKFGQRNDDTRSYTLATPLIAQLGKNFKNGYNKLITGDELLKLACDQVREIQMLLSGKFTYVECEDIKYLVEFYQSNGFRRIADRRLANCEKGLVKANYLVQLIKYIKN